MKSILFLIISMFIGFHLFGTGIVFPEVEGWNKSSEIKKFEADYLWDYINGAAESYHAYDFEVLHVCDYLKSDDVYVTVETYKHASPENAYGIYAAERPQAAGFIQTGAEGYYEEGILNFVKNDYYIKMRASTETINKLDMQRIADEIAKKLPGDNQLPKALELIPEKGKIPHSTLFVGENFIGYSSLYDAYLTDYKRNGNEFRIFLIARGSESDLDEMLHEYISRRTDMETLPLNELVKVEDPYNGVLFIIKKGNYALGTINLKDKDVAQEFFK